MADWEDEDIGYGRPPKWTRFRKGQSGNPRGRPKTKPPVAKTSKAHAPASEGDAILRSELERPIRIIEAGRPATLTVEKALRRRQIALAIKGNAVALRDLHRDAERLAQREAQLEAQREAEQALAESENEAEAALVRDGLFNYFSELKDAQARVWEEAASKGREEPDFPWPHPDDILLDHARRRYRLRGPMAETDVLPFLHAKVQRDFYFAQMVLFMRERGPSKRRLSRGRAYRVEAVDAKAGMVSLATPQGKAVIWSPAKSGGDQAEAFVEVEQELRTGDRVQFTRNNQRAGHLNGHTASVVGIDPHGRGITVEHEDGKHEALDLSRLADRHIRRGWVRTIHSAQGATADRVMAHLESFRANTVDAPAVYVAISRAKDAVSHYTDSRARLTDALGLRDGAQVGAIDQVRQEVEVEVEMG